MAINQEKSKEVGQFEYLGRWVDKKHFRAFVYNQIENKLAASYEEYERLIASGLWFPTKDSAITVLVDNKIDKVDKELEKSVEIAEENISNVTKFAKKPLKPNKQR